MNTIPASPVPLEERLIVALDVPTEKRALEVVDTLGDTVQFYKVGLELFCGNQGISLIQKLVERGLRVFADFKLYDVPATVYRAAKQLNGLGIDYLTVHGDTEIMEAAIAAAKDYKILAVTVLTSMGDDGAKQLGFTDFITEAVRERAHQAHVYGCAGVISSARESAMIKQRLGPNFLVVTPGIRARNTPADDQKRTATVTEAVKAGADHLVVGRQIRDASYPDQQALSILAEIRTASRA